MNISDKDVYEHMMNFADDKTIINMLSVNRQFNDEKFFEKVMKRRYPLLIEFRKEGESWKRLFIRMVHILAILNEKYNIPYIPTKGCDPEKLLKIPKRDIYNQAGMCAAAGNHVDILKQLIETGKMRGVWQEFNFASQYGSIQVMDFLYNTRNFLNLQLAMLAAIHGKQLSSIKFLQEKGVRVHPTSTFMKDAEDKGNVEIINYLKNYKNYPKKPNMSLTIV